MQQFIKAINTLLISLGWGGLRERGRDEWAYESDTFDVYIDRYLRLRPDRWLLTIRQGDFTMEIECKPNDLDWVEKLIDFLGEHLDRRSA